MVYLNYAMAIVMKFISVICWIIQFWTLGLLVSPAVSYRDEWMFIQALWKQRCFNSELWLKKPLGWFLGLLCQQPTCGAVSRILNNDNHECLMPVPVPPALPWPDMSPKTCPQACGPLWAWFPFPSIWGGDDNQLLRLDIQKASSHLSRLLLLFLVWCAELVLSSQSFSKVNYIPAQGSSKISASLSCVCVCIQCAEHLNAVFYLIRSEPWSAPVIRHQKSVWSWWYNFLTKTM